MTTKTLKQLEAEIVTLREALERLLSIAQCVSWSEWQTLGGDDGQGHYEGEVRAARTINKSRSILVSTAEYEGKVVVDEAVMSVTHASLYRIANWRLGMTASLSGHEIRVIARDALARLNSLQGGEG